MGMAKSRLESTHLSPLQAHGAVSVIVHYVKTQFFTTTT